MASIIIRPVFHNYNFHHSVSGYFAKRVWSNFTLKKVAYRTGTTTRVSTVAKPKPNMMVTAMAMKKPSWKSVLNI